jgi:hypothetical protein
MARIEAILRAEDLTSDNLPRRERDHLDNIVAQWRRERPDIAHRSVARRIVA